MCRPPSTAYSEALSGIGIKSHIPQNEVAVVQALAEAVEIMG